MKLMRKKKNDINPVDFSQIQELISQQKFGEAINKLNKIKTSDKNNLEVQALLEHLKKIVEYQNKDIFSSTNLNMDPWLE
jgi:hypothetical protein